MMYRVGDMIRYNDVNAGYARRRAKIIHIVHSRGRQRLYFRPLHINDPHRIWSRWNTDVVEG